jgi:hypothetical protein
MSYRDQRRYLLEDMTCLTNSIVYNVNAAFDDLREPNLKLPEKVNSLEPRAEFWIAFARLRYGFFGATDALHERLFGARCALYCGLCNTAGPDHNGLLGLVGLFRQRVLHVAEHHAIFYLQKEQKKFNVS